MDLRGMGSRRQGAMPSSVRSTDSGLVAQPRADRGERCLVKRSASPTGWSSVCRRPAAVWAGSLGRCAGTPFRLLLRPVPFAVLLLQPPVADGYPFMSRDSWHPPPATKPSGARKRAAGVSVGRIATPSATTGRVVA